MLFLRQLAPCIGRIEFTFVWDHSFASDNSPPHIAATQYSLATHLERVFRWTQTFTGWFHGFISVRRAPVPRRREMLLTYGRHAAATERSPPGFHHRGRHHLDHC